ncbi:hypothetical protein AAVH_24467 [Aphelenchoides avenae]|nr:hypothetical protein AAVH_24467 [Aphelenchus avenae]
MSDELSNAPSDHSDDSFDIVPEDASSGLLVHAPTPNGMDPIVDKLLEVLSGTTKVLAQNQAVLGNMAKMMEAIVKDKRQNEKQLEAITKGNDTRDLRMAGLSVELRRKCAAVESLDKAVEDAHCQIELLKDSEQEANRLIAAMSKKIKEVEELQSAGNLEIDELQTIVEDERAKVEALQELLETQNQKLVALIQNEQQLEARMAELAEELGRKCTTIESLEAAVDDAHYEINLLKDSEQETNRQMAETSKKIQELEELQAAGKREISELETIIQEERANVGAMKKLVEARDQELAALSQNVQKDRYRTGDASAQRSAYVRNKPKPFVETAQHAPLSQSVGEETMKTRKKQQSSMSKLKAFIVKKQAEAEMQKVCGRTVSLRASSGYFLCGNYDNAPATLTAIDANQDFVRFTVENAGNGTVALKSCGNYLTITEDGSTVKCRSSRNMWSHFDWIVHDSGEISLRGANGKYVSIEYGFVTCTRDEAGRLERFTVV